MGSVKVFWVFFIRLELLIPGGIHEVYRFQLKEKRSLKNIQKFILTLTVGRRKLPLTLAKVVCNVSLNGFFRSVSYTV